MTLLALFLSNRSKAQCPGPSDIPPVTQAWVLSTTTMQVIISPTCTLSVSYCTRQINNHPGPGQIFYQTYISGWTETGGGCGGVSLFTKIRAINVALVNTAPATPYCDPYSTMVQVSAACYKDQGGGAFSACGSGQCLKSWQYCKESGVYTPVGGHSYATNGVVNCDEQNGCLPYTCGDTP